MVIEPGAKVTLNGKLTSCTYWQGVRVKGNPGGQQYEDATGFYPNQGFLKSQSGTIENARIGVQLISDFPHFSSTKNGGVVQCYNTKFLNNKTGVDLSLYEYRNNDSYFDNCDFIMNNNTNEYLQSHANLSFFYGINFTNCKFKNLKSTPSVSNFGINSIRSMFTVSGANSEFIGLATGIKTSFYQGSVPFTVENATFEKCAIGIANNGIFGSNIQNNTFKFGEMPSSYFGTIINGQKTQIGVHEQSLMAGLGLSGNVFFNTKLNSDYDMTGIYINDIGDFSNQIKGNDFKDLTVGLSAVHWNATYQLGTDNTTPLNQGLMLLCNTNHPSNHNRIFDFYSASQDVPPIEALRNKHGIPLGQNNYMSVGNTFSFRNWPDAHDFSNLSANNIQYYKFTSDETPVNYGGLDLIDAASRLTCGGARVIFPKNPIAEFDQMQQLMDNSQQAYADAFAINDLNAMEEAENSIVYLQEQLDFIAFDGYIQAMEAFDMDEARFWMQKFNNLAGDLLLVADYMHTEEYTEAQNLLDQIETTYNFTPEKLADFQNVKYIYEQLMLNPVDQLPQNVMDNLRTWADSKNGQACYLARTIFGLLGNPYPPVVLEYIYNQDDNQQPAQRKKADNGINTPPVQIAIFPNPTNSDFEIRISNKSWNGKSTILLFDITGSQVGKYIIDEQQNQIKIQTNLPSGIYFCQIKGDGQVQLNQKIIINK